MTWDGIDRRHEAGWLRQAISDSDGLADMAYLAIGWLVAIMAGSVIFLCAMSAIAYSRCTQIVDVGEGIRSAIPCSYDESLKALGTSIAWCLGAFGSPIAALAAYMAATRRAINPGKVAPPAGPVVTTVTTTAVDDGKEKEGGNVKPGRGRPSKPHGELG